MIRVFRHYIAPLKLALISADFVVLVLAMLVGEAIRLSFIGGTPALDALSFFVRIVYALITATMFLSLGVYDSEALENAPKTWLRVIIGLALSGILTAALLFVFPVLPLWRSNLLAALGVSLVAVIASNSAIKALSRVTAWQRRLLILGSGEAASALVDSLGKASANSFCISGIIPDGPVDKALSAQRILSPETSISQFAADNRIDVVVVASSGGRDTLPSEELVACRLMGCDVVERRVFLERVRGIISLYDLDYQWILFAPGFNGGREIERALKRLVDLILASVVLVLTLPFMLLIAALVWVSSPGPIIFRQKRVGRNGHIFELLKFRSMRQSKTSEARWAEENDPRVTWIGRILRPTRLDELPQLVNVLRGEMSFVGPRPEQPEFVESLRKALPFYDVRHAVKPGITGWAQIHLAYAASAEDSRYKLERDLYYVKNFSIFLDMLIAIQTVRVILFRQGAR